MPKVKRKRTHKKKSGKLECVTFTLTGLPGTSEPTREVASARSVSHAVELLRSGWNGISQARDCGSVTVWLDDNGMWRCEFCSFRIAENESKFVHLAAVYQWLKDWWPKMSKPK